MQPRRLTLVRLLFWLATAGYWVVLCVLTHLPPRDLPRVGMNDKVEHLLAYGMLAGLISVALWVTFPRRPWLAWGVLVVGLAYGAVDERTQPMFGRTCDVYDWLADAVGTTAGVLPVLVLQRFVRLAGPGGRPGGGDAPGLGPELEAALAMYDPAAPPAAEAEAARPGPGPTGVRRVA